MTPGRLQFTANGPRRARAVRHAVWILLAAGTLLAIVSTNWPGIDLAAAHRLLLAAPMMAAKRTLACAIATLLAGIAVLLPVFKKA